MGKNISADVRRCPRCWEATTDARRGDEVACRCGYRFGGKGLVGRTVLYQHPELNSPVGGWIRWSMSDRADRPSYVTIETDTNEVVRAAFDPSGNPGTWRKVPTVNPEGEKAFTY